jgi:hypothetical protein
MIKRLQIYGNNIIEQKPKLSQSRCSYDTGRIITMRNKLNLYK